jgi:uncharacterized protein YkwD
MPDTFTIEENLDSGALSVTLQGSDMPYALPRSTPGFESGGPVEHEEIYLPGRERPIFQVKQARERPLVIKGAFRNHLFVRDGGDTGVSHARAMRDSIERIRKRANLLRLTWTGEQRLGLLTEATFGEESEHEISYELTFKIAVGVLDRLGTANEDGQRHEPNRADVVADLRARLAEIQTRLDALAQMATTLSTVSSIAAAVSVADSALEQLAVDADALDQAPRTAVSTAAAKFFSTGKSVQAAVAAAASMIGNTLAADVVPSGQAEPLAAWFAFQLTSFDALTGVAIELQLQRTKARAQIRKTVRLYTVRPGDTLESIARKQLGDQARASELGLAPQDLRPGRVVRIPEAA